MGIPFRVKPIFQISPSKLLVAHCGRALGLREKRVPADTPEWDITRFGSEIHDVFHEINMYQLPMNDLALDAIVAKCVSEDWDNARRYALKYIDNFPYRSVTMSEYCFGINDDLEECEYDTALFRGRIDVVTFDPDNENVATIIDHKSSWMMYDPDVFQLRYYAWAINKAFPWIDEVRLGINFLRYGKLRVSDYTLTRKDFHNTERAIIIAAEAAWSSDLKTARPGDYCIFCDYAMSCPAAKKDINIVNTPRQAIEAAEQLIVLDKQRGVVKDLLVKYVREKGNVELPTGGSFGFVETSSKKYDVQECLDIMSEGSKVSEEIRRALSINVKKIKTKEIPYRTIPGTRWGYRKEKEVGKK